MYVPIKGGEQAVAASRLAVERARRGDESLADIEIAQIIAQMGLALDRVMSEGGLYDPRLAAIAFKQAQGDLAEAIFLLRAHRARLPDFGLAAPIDLTQLRYQRYISATQKELAGGQILGATYDYTHRLLDFRLETTQPRPELEPSVVGADQAFESPLNDHAELIAQEAAQDPVDITRTPLSAKATPSERLAHLARGEEGYLTGLAYERLRKAGAAHPYVAELAMGSVEVVVELEDIGLSVSIGDLPLTICTSLQPNLGDTPHLQSGFGIAFGANERKAVAMAVVDQHIKAGQAHADVLMHCDGVAAAGYVSHLKLPHYSDFDADIARLRRIRAQQAASANREQNQSDS